MVLFAYLVVNRHRPVERSEVIEALWPAMTPDDAGASLSVLLSRLRRAIGADRLKGRRSVRLVLGDAVVDVEVAEEAIHSAESAVSRADWPRAWTASQTALFVARRMFLAGESAEWVDTVRRRFHEIHLRALEAYGLAALGLGGNEIAAAREAGRSLVGLSPLRESGHRLLMQALAAEGNPGEALAAYERLRVTLRDELGASPSDVTQHLYEQLLG